MERDLGVVLLVLALGLTPLVAALLRKRLGTLRVAAGALIVVSLLAVALAATLMRATSGHRSKARIVPRVVHEDGYVGSGACRSCHPSQHATWFASYHRTMTQVASKESILAPFDGTELTLEGTRWRLERKGDEFWVRSRPVDAVATDPSTEAAHRVVMATGSHNYQLYWLESAGQAGMEQFPLVYLLYERLWIPRQSRFLMPPMRKTGNESGRWKSHCIKCHATRGRKEVLPLGETRVAELGIACEACHGPGAAHVERHHAPLTRYRSRLGDAGDSTIVNPRRLTHERSTQVCGQCHSIEIFLDRARAQDWYNHGSRYRPGDDLAAFQTTVMGRYEDNPPDVRDYLDRHPVFRLKNCFWPDGMLRVGGREYHGLLETPCYQRGEMSCISCHSLHGPGDQREVSTWADDQLGPGMRGDRACTQCHAQYEEPSVRAAHTHHRADSPGSGCYNCHMPYTTWGLLRGIRSHQVDSPSAATSVTTGRPNACNLCHLDRTLQWTAQTLQEWYGTPPPPLSEEDETVAASIVWALSGDAVQRALMAWGMGWEPARQASGTMWMVPYLAKLLSDPYDAIRFNAQRTLRAYPEYTTLAAASTAGSTPQQQREIENQVMSHWYRTFPSSMGIKDARLLIDRNGRIDSERFLHLARRRDNTQLVLFE